LEGKPEFERGRWAEILHCAKPSFRMTRHDVGATLRGCPFLRVGTETYPYAIQRSLFTELDFSTIVSYIIQANNRKHIDIFTAYYANY
jgi:hypothetical protein